MEEPVQPQGLVQETSLHLAGFNGAVLEENVVDLTNKNGDFPSTLY
jgi:hypothetical protein